MRKFMIAATALMAAFVGGSLGAEPARATPALAGIAVPAQTADTSNVTPAQYWRGRRGYRRGWRGYRRGYRRGFYGRPFYGRSRVVCRTRFGYYGPRRVCYRRW